MLVETSIDCNISNKNENINCYMCEPSGKKLFDLDINKDIQQPSPCIKTTVDKIYNSDNKVKVKEIIIDNEKYYYEDNNNPSIYKFDKKLNGYIEIEKNMYSKLLPFINSN
jgi:hypothetical protein